MVFKYVQHKSFGKAIGRKIGTSATWSTKKWRQLMNIFSVDRASEPNEGLQQKNVRSIKTLIKSLNINERTMEIEIECLYFFMTFSFFFFSGSFDRLTMILLLLTHREIWSHLKPVEVVYCLKESIFPFISLESIMSDKSFYYSDYPVHPFHW